MPMIAVPADFADWLSPILVKELRQGMRRRIFVASFILLQVAMVFLAVASLAAAQVSVETAEYTVIFWIIVALPLVVTMPASGLTAVGEERRAGTLELMFLTQLSARRIFLGKWFAIVTQTALLVTTVVPYLVLRYYLGGVNLGLELAVLVGLMLGSAVLSGVAVGLSPLPAVLVRVLASIAVIFVIMGGISALVAIFSRSIGISSGSFSHAEWIVPLIFLLFGTLLFALMMEFGSSRIAPPAENHSTSIRLIGLASVAVSACFLAMDDKDPGMICLWLSDLLMIVIGAGLLCESLCPIPAVYRPFVRRGFWGRLAGRFFYPGWASAVNYVVLIFGLRTLLILAKGHFPLPVPPFRRTDVVALGSIQPFDMVEILQMALIQVVQLGALIFPVLLIRTFWRKTARPVATYFIIQAGAVVLFSIALIVQEVTKDEVYRDLAVILPPCAALSSFGAFARDEFQLFRYLPAAFVTLASMVILWLLPARRAWAEVREYERQADEPH